ncbi:MAG: efflux RND transporter periplasmic adaptor subunit [Candidatus Koribacter versatilis]|uniref:Efflux RND transporter periplasmic adaptor subunit n=1 Tax=Candidatus Korobacter versatilis TaxID=658062 RepID=A0A932A7E4_9BACT|nr:efflux RND transporter periplasmic adaptor subunit [Candidatus Koribacter versatilis]
MATQSPGFSVPLAEFAATMLAQREISPRARIIAEFVSGFIPEAAVAVYAIHDQDEPAWKPEALLGEIAMQDTVVEYSAGTLGALAEKREPVVYEAAELAREDYAHLNVRRTIQSLAYVPLFVDDETLIGSIEIVSFGKQISEALVQPVLDAAEVAAIGLGSAIIYENERNQQLESITRVTQMYDLEKVFNSTLEIDALVPIICAKFQEILNAQIVNLWVVSDEELLLTGQAGDDPRYELGATQKVGEGIAADVSEKAEPLLIDDPNDERLKGRNAGVDGDAYCVMVAPVIEKEKEVGVIEIVNRLDGSGFDEDDLFLLTTICEAAAGALHNAALLQTERKVEILETLVKVSKEITSTLNLDRVLQAVVDGPQEVIPYERASIALDQHGKLQMKAVSGEARVDKTDANIRRLDELMHWVAGVQQEIFATQHEDKIKAAPPSSEEKFRQYFAESGARGFFALPLTDEQGRVGIISFESSDPDFLNEAHFEMIKVLAGQATVAIRNAEMYKEVPFIGVLEPLLKRRDKFLSMDKHRRRNYMIFAASAAVFLAVFPLPMRLDGDATVAPAATAQIQPEVAGVVRRVLVTEGQRVTKGTIIAEMEDWDLKTALAAAEAKRADAVAQMSHALATGDSTTAGVKRADADYWTAETQRAQQRLEHARLRAPIDGIVATPHVENFAGRHLDVGEPFAEVINTNKAVVDIGIPESEAGLLQEGVKGWVKLEALPTQTFRGTVNVVSPMSATEGDHRVYFARVEVQNPEGSVRSGMQGRGKIEAGWHPAGYVLFRKPFLWAWAKIWSLMPW